MSTIKRPAPEIIEALYELGTDAVTSTMEALGVRRTFMFVFARYAFWSELDYN